MYGPTRGRRQATLCSTAKETEPPVNPYRRLRSGPLRTGRGTCHERAVIGSSGGRRRYDAASPEPMTGRPFRTEARSSVPGEEIITGALANGNPKTPLKALAPSPQLVRTP